MDPTTVIFICVGNSCRSQMAEGFARALGEGVLKPSSAGTAPAGAVSSKAAAVMGEAGVDITGGRPEPLDYGAAVQNMVVVLMGPELEDMCPRELLPDRENWGIEDPFGGTEDDYRRVRDVIRDKVVRLVESIRERG